MSSQNATSACPLCGAAGSYRAFVATDRNRAVTADRFDYHRCIACATLFQPEPPEDLDRFYPADYFSPPPPASIDRLALAEDPKLELLRPVARPPGRLVEIGPGEGLFARLARREGYAVTAIERDASACGHLVSVVGVDAVHSARPEDVLPDLPPSRVIALWHVLEHLPRPGRLLDAAAANLAPGGVLVVATPNPQALSFRLQGARWAHVDAPRHLSLVPVDALLEHVARRGLEPARLVFDDPGGRHWNRFAWESALRRRPSRGSARAPVALAAAVLARALRPIEGRGRRGAAYTALLRKKG